MNNHTKKSVVKSILRIVGYISLLYTIEAGIWILVASEVIGIWEEFNN